MGRDCTRIHIDFTFENLYNSHTLRTKREAFMSEKNNSKPEATGESGPRKSKTDPAVMVAIVSALATIMVTILGLPPLITYIDSRLNPTPTHTLIAPTATGINSLSETPAIIGELTLTPTNTEVFISFTPPALTETSTPTPVGVMKAELFASANTVRQGQHINFNARNSFVTFADGSVYNCVNYRFCSFDWYIYHTESATRTSTTTEGILSYTFEKRGNYTVTVYVCRSNICGYASTSIVVR